MKGVESDELELTDEEFRKYMRYHGYAHHLMKEHVKRHEELRRLELWNDMYQFFDLSPMHDSSDGYDSPKWTQGIDCPGKSSASSVLGHPCTKCFLSPVPGKTTGRLVTDHRGVNSASSSRSKDKFFITYDQFTWFCHERDMKSRGYIWW